MNPLEEYPLDGVDLDQRVNDSLGYGSVHTYQPDDHPSIRFSKFIQLDDNVDEDTSTRVIELFAEAKVNQMPRDPDGYEMDEVKIVSGVMMSQRILQTANGKPKSISQYMPEERFIDEFLTDPAVKIRVMRWFAEYRQRASFDEETLEQVNQQFVPTITETDNPFIRVLQ